MNFATLEFPNSSPLVIVFLSSYSNLGFESVGCVCLHQFFPWPWDLYFHGPLDIGDSPPIIGGMNYMLIVSYVRAFGCILMLFLHPYLIHVWLHLP